MKRTSGTQSRVKTITTYTNVELKHYHKRIGGISAKSADLRPYHHLPWLAEQLDCDIEALILWCCRLAADEFYDLITDFSDPSVNQLEQRVNYLTSRLRYRFKSDVLSSLVQCMAICKIMHDKIIGIDGYMPEFNLRIFYHLCNLFYFFGIDPSTQSFTVLLKEDWEKKGRITNHPYQSIRDVRFDTFKQSLEWMRDNYVDQLNSNITLSQDESTVLKKFTSFLRMRDGFKLSGSIPMFIEEWNGVRYQLEELEQLAENLLDTLNKSHNLDYKRIEAYCKDTIKVDDDWTNSLTYSPDTAEILRGKARDRILNRLNLS